METFGKLQRSDGDGAHGGATAYHVEDGTTTNGRGASDGIPSPPKRSF